MSRRNLLLGLFVVAVIAQLAVPGWLLARHENVVRNGETFRFRCVPIDPVDVLWGRYVALRFAGNDVPAGALIPDGEVRYAVLVVDEDGFARIGDLLKEPPESGPYLKTKTGRLEFDRFYMNEKLAPEAESAMRERERGTAPVYLEVRILNGDAVPVELYIDDTPAAEYVRGHP